MDTRRVGRWRVKVILSRAFESTMPIEIPDDYARVVAATGVTMIPLFYGAYRVMRARKTYDVKYPNLYAPENHPHKKAFDCAQRGHQNTLENYASTVACGLVSGLAYPSASAALMTVWSVGRVMYARGYAEGGPSGRRTGAMVAHVGDVPLFFMTFAAAWKLMA